MFFEIETNENLNLAFDVGTIIRNERDSVTGVGYLIVQAEDSGDGWFKINSPGGFNEETVSITILCETKNATGVTALDRRYAWRSSWHYDRVHRSFLTLNLFGK